MDWYEDAEVEGIAKAHIRTRDDFDLLRAALERCQVRLICVSRPNVIKRAGKQTWATARKVAGREAYAWQREDDEALPVVLVIEVSGPIWMTLDQRQKEALVFHELLHFTVHVEEDRDGREEWSFGLVGHDVEEFRRVIEEFGLWRSDIRPFAEAASAQLDLPIEEESPYSGIEHITVSTPDSNSVTVKPGTFAKLAAAGAGR